MHKHNISKQWNSSLKRPGFRLSCFLCFVQQVREKKLVVALAVESFLQYSVLNNSHSTLDSLQMQSYNFLSDRPKDSQCPFLTLTFVDVTESLKKVVVKLQQSKFSALENEEHNDDWFSVLNLCLCQFYVIQLIIDLIQTLEQFCVDSPKCFSTVHLFWDSVATTIRKLITVGAVGKQFHCFRDNAWVWILVSFSTGIDSILHEFIETFIWNVFQAAIKSSAY